MIDWLFYGPAKLIALWPHSGIAIAAVLLSAQALLNLHTGKRFGQRFFREAPVLAGLLWLIFGFYEPQIGALKQLTGYTTPLFRIDMLVLTPILYVLTVAAIMSIARQWRSGKDKTKS